MFKRSDPFVDPVLGRLDHHRRHWRGTIELSPFGAIPLTVPGSRKRPDEAAMVVARTAAGQFERARATIVAELAEHGRTYGADVEGAGEIAPAFAAVIELDRRLVLEFGYQVPWDDDHTLGARVSDGLLVELNGSVIGP